MKIKKYRISLWLIMFLVILQSFKSHASNSIFYKEVLFVLDASGSMKTNDPNRLAVDGIAQMIHTLPDNYKSGFIAYNTEIVISQVPVENEERERIIANAKTVNYTGYTNAGAGLSQAVDILSNSSAAEKHIVLLSDGEILMADSQSTQQSAESYENAMKEAAQKDIRIHVIGLGSEMKDTGNPIFSAAVETNGGIYYTPQAAGIQQAIDDILDHQLQIKRITVAIVEEEGDVETLSIAMPFAHASKVRVLLTSNSMIRNLNSNFQAVNGKQINGERYSLIEIDRPQSSQLDLSFSGASKDRVIVTLIPEYHVIAKVKEVVYEDTVPMVEEAVCYDRKAMIAYSFYDAENESLQLWTEEFFNHTQLSLKTGEEISKAALLEGEIQLVREVTDPEILHTTIDYSDFAVNIIGSNEVEILLEEPPKLPEKEPQPPYLFIIFGALVLIGGLIPIWFTGCRKQNQKQENVFPKPGKYSYVGQLNIYITRTKSGYDIPPLSYDLFRLPQTKVISIQEVLESCGVTEPFEGADRIYIKSGPKRSIIVTNQSDCTLMKRKEILLKKESCSLFDNAKVDIMFEDELSELTFQYKDLRPSEIQ